MIRIVALNEDSDGEDSNCDEITVTKEAEETIAISEYIRALEYKSKGRTNDALTLLSELLETNVLHDISPDEKDNKLACVRYNCHKNIALIYEEQGDNKKALEHFMQAMELDDTEVHVIHRLGRLSLKEKEYGLAQHAFEKCLKRNSNHWPSVDGLLEVYCLTGNIMGAYGWALQYYNKDKSYGRAKDVLIEITEKFGGMIDFFKTVWKIPFEIPADHVSTGKKGYFLQDTSEEVPVEDVSMVKPNLESFRIETLNWLSVGQYICDVYNHLKETKQSIIFILSIDDMLLSGEKASESDNDVEISSNKENCNTLSTGKNAEDVSMSSNGSEEGSKEVPSFASAFPDSPQPVEGSVDEPENDVSKPKVRRRCSDLNFLEQWGWHKNRRYSNRKKSQQERPDADTSVNGFLKRIFADYFNDNFDTQSPFLLEKSTQNSCENKNEDVSSKVQNNIGTYNDFQKNTANDFEKFLQELKSQNFDLIFIIFLWLKYVSKYWDQYITDQMKSVYYDLYSFYLNHYDLATWNLLSTDDFNASFRMCLMYLELKIEKEGSRTDVHLKEISAEWRMLFHHLRFNSGCVFVISDEFYEHNIIRLIHLEYCWAKLENHLTRSVESLMHLEELISEQGDDYTLKLPNFNDLKCINFEAVKNIRTDLQRKISLNNVKTLYDDNKFEDLVHILKDSLIYSTEIKNSDNSVMKIQTQFEVLLESLWNLEKYEECLIWSERCLKHAVDNLLSAPTDTYRYEEWCESINFILIYLEELVLKDGDEILIHLDTYLSRLVQSLVQILSHQLDAPFDKNNNQYHPVNIKRPWVILHQVLQKTENTTVTINLNSVDGSSEKEDIEEVLPQTILLLFTAHEYLGRRQWCTRDSGQLLLYTLDVIIPKLRAPCMDSCRETVIEYLEQITYCLYGYPPKKARSRHIEEHEATSIDLNWKRAIQLFDLYRPENLPEFNSYKLESISTDMEQLLLKIVAQIPKEIDPVTLTSNIYSFIKGQSYELEEMSPLLPQRISSVYYLLADYYFKSRDFLKTVRFYVLDLTCNPGRFDSWAGLALSKASKLDTKLNSFTSFDLSDFLTECENAVRCFEQCIHLNSEQTLLWIEYGSFAYSIHSFCSRYLKHSSHTLSMEQFAFVEDKKDKYLNISFNCFSVADKCSNGGCNTDDEGSESHDDKWLNQYMLGKIAEKRKEHPKVYIDHYLLAANYLYENNATYPIKVNHSNPTSLSIEALEIFYRTNCAIIKYVEQQHEVPREIGKYFLQVLKNLASSPFAFNKAKIDDNSLNALKRKLPDITESESQSQIKRQKSEQEVEAGTQVTNITNTGVRPDGTVLEEVAKVAQLPESKEASSSRRGSQESTATTTTTSATGTSSSTSSSSGSDSSSSESDDSDSGSDSSSEEDTAKPDDNTPFSATEMEVIYKSCVRNFEECFSRFPEHYKSIYRLVNHYLNAPAKWRDVDKCKQLLLGTYTTALDTQITGLFADRKNNNFFNGIWRIPTSEIDRPGSFSSHMVKCVNILIDVLHKSDNHKLLIDIGLQLRKNPDNDKRYIKDNDRLELYQQSTTFCVQSMRDILKRNVDKRNEHELLTLCIDVYKTHKKCLKHMNQKEPVFAQLLVDVYKAILQMRNEKIPENTDNRLFVEMAIKLSIQEITARKHREATGVITSEVKAATEKPPRPVPSTPKCPTPVSIATAPSKKASPIPTPTTKARGRPVGSKSSTTSNAAQAGNLNAMQSFANALGLNSMDSSTMSSLISMYAGPSFASQVSKDPIAFQNLVAEYYKLIGSSALTGIPPVLPNLAAPLLGPIANPLASQRAGQKSVPIPASNTLPTNTSASTTSQVMPQFDIKNLIASAASQVSKTSNTQMQPSSTTINIGGGELTITPTMAKAKEIRSGSPKVSSTTNMGGISVTKVPLKSPTISVKSLSDLTGRSASSSKIPALPELPKSLTITPSPAYVPDRPKVLKPQVSVTPDPQKLPPQKVSGKSKNSSLPKKSSTASTAFNWNPLPDRAAASSSHQAALSQQYPAMGNFNLDNFNSQATLLATYADLLKSMGNTLNPALLAQMSQMPAMSQFQMLGQKKAYNKKAKPAPKPDNTAPKFQHSGSAAMGMQSPLAHGSPTMPKSKARSFTPPYPLNSMARPSSNSSPTIGMNPNPMQSSPTKTLQQKLAEKQKMNQMNDSSSGAARTNQPSSSKRGNVDVIILD